jgi:molybdate transport system ATP-binding protein
MGGVAVEVARTRTRPFGDTDAPSPRLSVALTKGLRGTERDFVLNVSFEADAGFTILFGPSGAGKTTVLDCIAGLTAPDTGRIAFGSRVLFDSELRIAVPVPRRNLGYVFQDLALFPHMTVSENVQYGLATQASDVRRQRCEILLDSFRIAHLGKQKPSQISGGERQRAALARALVTDPCGLLLDEPLAGLDAPTKSGIVEDLRRWNAEHRIPILYVSHHREEVFALGDRMLVLESGSIIAEGTPHEVLTAPRLETVAQLAGFENLFDVTVTALHEGRGTMTCRLDDSAVELETPLVRAETGSHLRVGIRAGDILLGTERPVAISARNIIPGQLVSLEQHDVIVMANVDCGVNMKVQLTLAARDALALRPGREVWLILKTHSCHLMRPGS